MTKKLLDGLMVYLCGPINFCRNSGREWRKSFCEQCFEADIRFTFLDPTRKPFDLQESEMNKGSLRRWKAEKDWGKVATFVKKFRHVDLKMVDACNILVIYIDTDIHMMGSYDELITAERECKPIIAVVKQGKGGASDWLFGAVEPKFIFDSIEQAISWMKQVNDGEKTIPEDWIFIRKEDFEDNVASS